MKIRGIALLAVFGLQAGAQTTAAGGSLTLASALESTLRDHPLLHIQEQQVQYGRAALLRAQSQFDRVLSADANLSRTYAPLDQVERTVYDASSATTNFASVDAAASQQFRNGITAGPVFSVTRTTDNVATQYGLNQSHFGYQVVDNPPQAAFSLLNSE